MQVLNPACASSPPWLPPSRSFIPEEQCQGRSPQLLLQAALAHMHYLPEEPGAGGKASAYRQMAQLLQYRAVRVGRGTRRQCRPGESVKERVQGQRAWHWLSGTQGVTALACSSLGAS